MAITIIKQPQLYSPAFNDSIIQVESDLSDILFFMLTVTKPNGISILSKLKIYPTPAYRNGSYLNLKEILKSVAQTTIIKNDNIVQELDDVYSYRLNISEYVSGDDKSLETTLQTSFYNIFNGQLSKVNMFDYDYKDYVATSTSIPQFLTNKPTSNIYYSSTEYLYYLNNNHVTEAQFTLNYSTGTITNHFQINSVNKSGRINISPKSLEVEGIILDDLISYTVTLMASNVTASLPVTRYYKPDDCNDKYVNIIWENNLGGVDSYTFKSPREKISVDKVIIKNNAYPTDSNIYEADEVTLSVNATSEYTVISDWLNDAESIWLPSIITSKKVYVELYNGQLMPIKVANNTATINNSRYNKMLNSFELTFQAESGLLF